MLNETENQTGESQQAQNTVPFHNSKKFEERMEKLNQNGNKSNKRKKIYLMIGIILLSGIVAGSYYFRDDVVNFLNPKKETGKIDCMMDTKECPDGSFVSRIPPTCEFAECLPVIDGENTIDKVNTFDWQTYRNKEYGFEIKYPIDWKVGNKEDTKNPVISISGMSVLSQDSIGNEKEMTGINITVLDNSVGKSLDDYSWINESEINDSKVEIEMEIIIPKTGFQINNVEAIKQGIYNKSWDLSGIDVMINFSSEKIVFLQFLASGYSEENFDTFNQIISTFELFQDTDSDGLSDDEEAEYGCDINNPDSDGDGYLDGDEVENGYDPMGEGKL